MENSMLSVIKETSFVVVTINANSVTYKNDDPEFDLILETVEQTLADSREMPAFGVSLDTATREAMQYGIWIEFCFDGTKTHNDMPFDALLINIKPENTGINIIRKYNNKYEGRCFYFDLSKNINLLYEVIIH